MPPIRTKGSLYTLDTLLGRNEERSVDLPLALQALGKCQVFHKEVNYNSRDRKYGIRWSDAGDRSRIRRIRLNGQDVSTKMKTAKSGTVEFDGAGLEFQLNFGATLTLEVFADEPQEMKQALAASALLTSFHHPNDVRLYFPRLGRDLWTSSALLMAKSPYFKTILTSSFSEGVSTTLASMATKAGSEIKTAAEFEDSDDEADEAMPKPTSSAKSTSPSCDRKFHVVTITGSCFTSYRAVLGWLNTGHLDFADLSPPPSIPVSPPTSDIQAQISVTSSQGSTTTETPSPASVRSVFRLAHFLSLDDLVSIALDALAAQLTLDNIIHHLFNEVTAAYTEVADVVTAFAARNWSAIKQSATALSVEKEIKVSGRALDTRVAWNLMKRLT